MGAFLHFTDFYVFTQSSVVFQQYAPLNLQFVLIALYINKDLSSQAIGLYFCTNCSVLLGRDAILAVGWLGDFEGYKLSEVEKGTSLVMKWRCKF